MRSAPRRAKRLTLRASGKLLLALLGMSLCLATAAAAEEGDATVESTRSSAEACQDGTCVVFSWEGYVVNKTLGDVEAVVRLVFRGEGGAEITRAEVGTVQLGRMEGRPASAVLEVEAATWEKIVSVGAEIASVRRISEPQGVSPGTLTPDVRSQEEKAADVERQRQQLAARIEQLQRDVEDREAEYDLIRMKVGPFGLLDSDSERAKKIERELDRASRRLQDANQSLREAQQKMRQLR